MKKLIYLLMATIILSTYSGSALAADLSKPFFIIETDAARWDSLNAESQAAYPNSFSDDILPQMDAQPVVLEGRLLVPIRWFAEVVKFNTSWEAASQEISLSGSKQIKMAIGSTQATVDGRTISLEVPPQIISGRTMVPLRFISEAFGYQVYYNQRLNSRPEVWITYDSVLSEEEYRILCGPDWDNFEKIGEDNLGWATYRMKEMGETPRHNRLGDSISQVLSTQGTPQYVIMGLEAAHFYEIKTLPEDWTGTIGYRAPDIQPLGAGWKFFYEFTFNNGALTRVELCT